MFEEEPECRPTAPEVLTCLEQQAQTMLHTRQTELSTEERALEQHTAQAVAKEAAMEAEKVALVGEWAQAESQKLETERTKRQLADDTAKLVRRSSEVEQEQTRVWAEASEPAPIPLACVSRGSLLLLSQSDVLTLLFADTLPCLMLLLADTSLCGHFFLLTLLFANTSFQ